MDTMENNPIVGDKIRKFFANHGWFEGSITELWTQDDGTQYFAVVYEDEDFEDLTLEAVVYCRLKYIEHNNIIISSVGDVELARRQLHEAVQREVHQLTP